MSRKLIQKTMFLVVPPNPTLKNVESHLISTAALSHTENGAWDRFVFPALKKDAYVKDGYKAIKVRVEVYADAW